MADSRAPVVGSDVTAQSLIASSLNVDVTARCGGHDDRVPEVVTVALRSRWLLLAYRGGCGAQLYCALIMEALESDSPTVTSTSSEQQLVRLLWGRTSCRRTGRSVTYL